jgi:hypothetical protein
MVQFLSTWVETRLMSVKEDVYYIWQIYFLHQFIPLVRYLLFLRVYNSDDSTEHSTGIMWTLWIRLPFIPVSWVVRALSWCPTEFSLGCQMSQVFSNNERMKALRMCENFNFPTVAENMYSSVIAINQPLRGRNRTGRGSCVV